jgi:hypothetical protein
VGGAAREEGHNHDETHKRSSRAVLALSPSLNQSSRAGSASNVQPQRILQITRTDTANRRDFVAIDSNFVFLCFYKFMFGGNFQTVSTR